MEINLTGNEFTALIARERWQKIAEGLVTYFTCPAKWKYRTGDVVYLLAVPSKDVRNGQRFEGHKVEPGQMAMTLIVTVTEGPHFDRQGHGWQIVSIMDSGESTVTPAEEPAPLKVVN